MSTFDVNFFKAPPVVSKRNEFHSAEELADDAMFHLPEKCRDEAHKTWMLLYTERIIKVVASHFAVGAERGARQVGDLLLDPEFYETRKRRRAQWKKAHQEHIAKTEAERLERRSCPTAEQIADEIARLEKSVTDYEQYIERANARLEQLRAMRPHRSQTRTGLRSGIVRPSTSIHIHPRSSTVIPAKAGTQ